MANEKMGLLGFKVGMTQIYNESGSVIPVTVVSVEGNTVLTIKTEDTKDGYNAIQLGIGEKKEKHSNKAEMGITINQMYLKKHIREVRLSSDEVNHTLLFGSNTTDVFSVGDKRYDWNIKVISFAGVMKHTTSKGLSALMVHLGISVAVVLSVLDWLLDMLSRKNMGHYG